MREVSLLIDASAPRPTVVRAPTKSLLRRMVKASAPEVVELVWLGRSEAVDRYTPARFDFIGQRAGTCPVRLQHSGRTIGRLVLTAP